MPLKIVRNDITKMRTEAIVNTASPVPGVGTGCDYAIYQAAGLQELLEYRKINIGSVPEGEAFVTPAFNLDAKYIIHAVSPYYYDGNQGEEEKLRACYRNSLKLALDNNVKSISFPLISTGGYGYPKEEGLRVAVDEINDFLMKHEMDIFLVVFDAKATNLGKHIIPELESYIDEYYVEEKRKNEYEDIYSNEDFFKATARYYYEENTLEENVSEVDNDKGMFQLCVGRALEPNIDVENLEKKLNERMQHLSDTFSEYLIYLISQKGMENSEVYKRAIVDKKTFSKIKNNPDYHPQKITALCLCVGAKLNLDETKDLLARAGYALSPCDKTDIIFSYFIENEYYDMLEIDIQLEEHGLECIIK